MCVRLEFDKVKEIFKSYNCTLLSKEYKNNRTKMEYICDLHSDITQEVTLGYINSSKKTPCKKCKEDGLINRNIKVTKSRLLEKNASLKDFEYIDNNKSKIWFICNKHPNLNIQKTTSWSLRNSNNVCKDCAYEYRAKIKIKKSLPKIIEIMKRKGYKKIEGVYKGVNEHVEYICEEHPYKIQSAPGWSLLKYEDNCKWCRYRKTSGENSNFWRGGIANETKRLRDTIEYKEWRESVFERDSHTCQACGQQGGSLNAHHLVNFSDNEELRHDINNGVTLCKYCHMSHYKDSFHNIYGTHNNTVEQFEEFLQLKKEGKLIKYTVKISELERVAT